MIKKSEKTIQDIEPGSLDYKILMKFVFDRENKLPKDLAITLNRSHSTINSAIKRMERDGYIKWIPYGSIELLPKGIDALSHIELHHNHLENFLIDSLDLDPETAHIESINIAPHISCTLIKKICEKYGTHTSCPLGREFPKYKKCHTHSREDD